MNTEKFGHDSLHRMGDSATGPTGPIEPSGSALAALLLLAGRSPLRRRAWPAHSLTAHSGRFHCRINRLKSLALSPAQLADYFTLMLRQHSWSGVKLDLYGLKFFTEHVLAQPWHMPGFIRAPKTSRLPDIVSVSQAQAIFDHTRCLSYRVFFFTLYSLGLRLGQGLALSVADIDAERMRVQVRNAKGNRDRRVPLPQATLALLRRFWACHRHPTLLFPNRSAGQAGAHSATRTLERSGAQRSLALVVEQLGIKKISPHSLRHSYAKLAGTPSALAVLHTHNRPLGFHPHVHVFLPAAAFDASERLWRTKVKLGKTPGSAQATFRYRDAKSGQSATPMLPGADFLRLLLQHVLPKGFQRARNFGFLHHNSRRVLHLLQVLHSQPSAASAAPPTPPTRPVWRCACGAAMVILRRRMRSEGVTPCAAPQTERPDKAGPVEASKR